MPSGSSPSPHRKTSTPLNNGNENQVTIKKEATSPNGTILYTMPQGIVYANERPDSSPADTPCCGCYRIILTFFPINKFICLYTIRLQ